jgi:hypothetical protein
MKALPRRARVENHVSPGDNLFAPQQRLSPISRSRIAACLAVCTENLVGVRPDLARRVLNHVSCRSEMKEIYDMDTYMEPMRDAMDHECYK